MGNIDNNKIKIIDNYINNKIFKTNIDKTSFLYDLAKFCSENKIPKDIDFWCELIRKNKSLNSLLQDTYVSSKTSELESNFMVTLIDAYCIVENKDIQNDCIFKEEDNNDVIAEFGDNDYNNIDGFSYIIKTIKKFNGGKLKPEEEKKLFHNLSQLNKEDMLMSNERDELILRNVGLVMQVARMYSYDNEKEFEENFQNGIVGLIKAIERFDYRLGYKFSTYATWWIRQEMLRSQKNTGSVIRIPVHMTVALNRLKKIMTANNLSGKNDNEINALAELSGYSKEKVKNILILSNPIVSLDQPAKDDEADGDSLINFIEGDPTDFTSEIFKNEVYDLIFNSGILTDREEKILKLRFGIGTNAPLTLEDTAKYFNLTKERIRQIESKALSKLRGNKKVRTLNYNKY